MSTAGLLYPPDHVRPLIAGDNVGVAWNIGVLSGAHSHTQLLEAPHTHLVASIAALADQ